MSDSTVQTLVNAARLHLWREAFRVAVRRAGWIGAALTSLAVLVHLALLPVPVAALVVAVVLPWIAVLAWTASRRPSDADAALWIDRHLGGASAFTTLLDARSGSQAAPNAQALRWLELWTAAKVPDVLRSLGARRPSTQVSGALLTMAVCSALALLVLTLPDAVPSSRRQAGAAAASGANDKAPLTPEAPVAAQLASEISSALRSTDAESEPERKSGGGAPAAGPTSPEDGGGSPVTPPASALPDDRSVARDSASGPTIDAATTAGSNRSAAAVSGREAGDSADTRADGGVSKVPRGTIPAQRSASTVRLAATDRQADMEQAASFDETVSVPGGTPPRAAPVAAAATPPPAAETARLSPTETSYVQAWMKAIGRSR